MPRGRSRGSAVRQVALTLPSIHCEGCVTRIREALAGLPMVASVEGDPQAKRVVVTLRGGPDGAGAIAETLGQLGHVVLGFIEPCTIGSTLLFARYLEGKDAARTLVETALFAATRAVFIGALGLGAVLLGSAFLGFQKGAWIALGAVYVLIGLLYLTRRARALMVSVGPRLSRRAGLAGPIGLGLLFGLNIPACAAPLILALLAAAAAGGSAGATAAHGFLALSVFGLALSLPLIVAVLVPRGRRVVEWLAGLSHRFPTWAGLVLAALGLWSIAFGLFVSVGPA